MDKTGEQETGGFLEPFAELYRTLLPELFLVELGALQLGDPDALTLREGRRNLLQIIRQVSPLKPGRGLPPV